jgi:multidrug efflux pump subunit AcrB
MAILKDGIIRQRPVLITVRATITALIPLASHVGLPWKPLWCAQIGGLLLATFITKLFVPLTHSFCVFDLKIVHWMSVKKEGIS